MLSPLGYPQRTQCAQGNRHRPPQGCWRLFQGRHRRRRLCWSGTIQVCHGGQEGRGKGQEDSHISSRCCAVVWIKRCSNFVRQRSRTSKSSILTSCRADTSEGGQATGAMSYAFITALRKKPQQTYQELLTNIRTELSGKYSQKPQLSCSHPLGERCSSCRRP